MLQIARIFYVASQSEENALAWNAFLIGQSTGVVASNVGSIADIALSIEPQRYLSESDDACTAD